MSGNNAFRAKDHYWMQMALEQAQQAAEEGEVPVGAVLVSESDTCLALGRNQSITLCDPTAHAEIMALRQAGHTLQNYRLPPCTTLYVTLEPCLMCCGALLHARVDSVIFAAPEEKTQRLCHHLQLPNHPHLNHRMQWRGGCDAQAARALLKTFFQTRRVTTREGLE